MKYLSIYVHIPFCLKKCDYCNFTSFSCCEHSFERYFLCLENEINNQSINYKNRKINTIFIGGGTPSLVSAHLIEKLMQNIKQNFNLTKNCEITIECNPDSITVEKLQIYKNCGINRISFGVQSLNDKLLKLIGRPHNRKQALCALQNAKKIGFKNINADVMLGLPTQTKHMALSTVKNLISAGANHISLYTLILEENTPLFKKVNSSKLNLPTDDETVKMFSLCSDLLKKQAFSRYEVANFAKNKKCVHNLGYWQNADYVGFGISAHSKIANRRFFNTSNLQEYLNNKNKVTTEILTPEQIREEKIMLGLRTAKGISCNLVKNKITELNLLKKNKFIEIKNNRVCATEKGFFILNQIILMLV